ncbi:uncharacterized protein LOC120933415 [Rana temporaria]|uniref:uncharacterized protein LOC120933415 n=1 Tax=Rana temporaria TaxID=8407 RepID=UPI001AAE1367|nr:uncharacterized protein LOC120933415 [Rana temporaria]
MVDKYSVQFEFIKQYRELTCLWNVKSRDYSNKSKRKAALQKLVELLKPLYPTADINYVKGKIGSLRSTYNKERKKVLESKRSGVADDEIYVPRLWYYNSLRFLSDQNESHQSLSTLPSTSAEAADPDVHPSPTQEEDAEEPGLTQDSGSEEEPGPSSQSESQIPSLRPPTKRARKTENLDEATAAFLSHATNAISIAPDSTEAFGCMAAAKLREMDDEQRCMCEELILQLLNKGRRGQICPKTQLCVLDETPPQQPSPPQQHGGQCKIQPQDPQKGSWAGDFHPY